MAMRRETDFVVAVVVVVVVVDGGGERGVGMFVEGEGEGECECVLRETVGVVGEGRWVGTASVCTWSWKRSCLV